jgi:hypothetical protein
MISLFPQYRLVNIYTGGVVYYTVDSLSAFWPGLQVLAGDVQKAIKAHQLCKLEMIGTSLLLTPGLRLEHMAKVFGFTRGVG